MAGSSILVINAAGAETRVALVESGTIHEFYLERKREKGIVGNIYKGRVVRVLPGMQAAFVDIGLEKAAFLYVGDVYGDPDFSEEFELTEGEHGNVLHEVPTEQEAEEQEARARAEASRGEASLPDAGQPAAASEPPPVDLAAAPGLEVPAQDAGELALAPPAGFEAVAAPPDATPVGDEQASLTPIALTHAVGMEPVPALPPLLVPLLSPADASGETPVPATTSAALEEAVASPAQAELQLQAVPPPSVEPVPAAGQLQARPAEAAREAR
ncbi:MAG TPA: ribonuclease G, partial [Anaeromyxobacteraceae bacterium]